MDVRQRTGAGLDWPVILDALAGCARTSLGRDRVRALAPLPDAPSVARAWDAVEELRAIEQLGQVVPIGDVEDISDEVRRAARGEILEAPLLRRAASVLRALVHLARVLARHEDEAPTLSGIAAAIHVDPVVLAELEESFDPLGALSATRYPRLGELRRQIASLHTEVRATLEGMVRGDEMGEVLQDRFWTQRQDRYVLPIKSYAKRFDLGIVHGTSGSGQTVFVEPHQVIALNNQLRIAEGELAAEERRILAALSAELGTVRDEVLGSLEAVGELDLAAAREGLAVRLGGSRPRCGEDGLLSLRAARHPVLVLRGVEVVANDLFLSAERPALVLSGPNAGGKTVAMKTAGLCALLVQHGCFVPAAPESRVDRFPAVVAAIGDQQTVQGDLSSFSAHLADLGTMMEGGPGELLLLDELASGTDPSQGAALAQAVLERLVERGARVIVTTHYARLKALPASDPRFQVAAVQQLADRPTYRLLPDTTGESHAFDIASRMGIDAAVIGRARSLVGTGELQLSQALEALEAERERVGRLEDAARTRQRELDAERAALRERERRLEEEAERLRELAADAFLDRLRKADRAIGQVVAELQRSPDHKRVAAARAAVDAMRDLVPEAPARQVEPAGVAVGEQVRLVAFGKTGEVVRVGGGVVHVRTGGVVVKTRPDAVERVGVDRAAQALPGASSGSRRGGVELTRAAVVPELDQALRIPGNTLDMRGMRVEEGLEAVDQYLDESLGRGRDVVFLLHGHGTGALKQGIRDWLRTAPQVGSWAPANSDQGGDAFTVVRLV